MNPLLVLGLVTLTTAQINTKAGGDNDPNKKLFQLPFVDAGTSNLLWGGALGVGATLLGQEFLGNNNNNNPCGGFGRRRRQAGEDPNKKIFGLFENNNCNQGYNQGYQQPNYQQPTNPCGRKKRQSEGVDTGDRVDTKFFGLENLFGGGSSNNCGYTGNYNQPQGYQPSNQGYQPTNQGYQNGYNSGYSSGFQNGASSNQGSSQGYNQGYNQGSSQGYNQGSSQGYNQGSSQAYNQGSSQIQNIRVCQCSNYSKKDRYGYEEARCKKADHTGRKWCYATSSSNCNDAQGSSKYPNNPWSYEACNSFNG